MEEGLDLNYIRFNEAKKEHGDANHRRLIIASSTLGGSTSTLPLSADNVSEFYRRMVFTFTTGSTGPFTFQVPSAERIYYVDNQSGNVITLDATSSTESVSISNNTKYQMWQSSAGNFIVLD